jgi:nucleoside-diphosphate-sugar epimerase
VSTLITGAGGYLGGLLARRLTRRWPIDGPISPSVAHWWGAAGSGAEILALNRAAADLTDPHALDHVDTSGITHIIHSAAVTSFGVDKPTAQAVNIDGTRHVLELAQRCPDLERFVLLSTLYTAGTRTGDIPEALHEQTAFANNYEWSKHEAETLTATSGLPATIIRVATIAADDESGHVTQYNAVHNTLKLVYYGLLSLIPGDPATAVPLATADYTIAAIEALLTPDPSTAGSATSGPATPNPATPDLRVCHVSPSRTATLGELLDIAYDVFAEDPSFARRRILRPVFCDRESFDDLLEGARSMRAGPVHDALTSVAPFAAQLYLPKTFATQTFATWAGIPEAGIPEAGIPEPDPRELVRAVVKYLVASRWGRNS